MNEGYNDSLFLNKDLIADLQCPICLGIVRDCVETSCGHLFCEICITDYLNESPQKPCPICQDEGDTDEPSLTQIKSTRRRVMNLRVCCEYGFLANAALEDGELKDQGDGDMLCNWEGSLNDMFQHLQVCDLRKIECVYAKYGCDEKLTQRDMGDHLTTQMASHLELVTETCESQSKEIESLNSQIGDLQKQNEQLRGQLPPDPKVNHVPNLIPDDDEKNPKPHQAALNGGQGVHRKDDICEKYRDLVKDTISTFLDLYKSDSWYLVGGSRGVPCSRTSYNGLDFVKGSHIISYPFMTILCTLLDIEKKGIWSKSFQSGRVVQQIDRNTSIRYEKFKATWPTYPRDFVMLVYWRFYDDKTVMITSSVDHPDVPETTTHVRGYHKGGYILKPLKDSPEKTEVTFIGYTDYKGNVPISITKSYWNNAPLFLKRIARCLKDFEDELDFSVFDVK